MSLTSRIQALINYANEITGKGDLTLGDCIKTLCDGYIVEGRLPAPYQQVEYLESTGEQWIDTLYTGDMFDVWRIDFQFTKFNATPQLNGGFYDAQAVDIGVFSDTSWFARNGGARIATKEKADLNRHTALLSRRNNTLLIDDSVSIPMEYSASSAKTYLFARASGRNAVELQCHERIFLNQLYDSDGILIQDLVPCYRKVDHKPGMYDRVFSIFHINKGNGADFILGPDM